MNPLRRLRNAVFPAAMRLREQNKLLRQELKRSAQSHEKLLRLAAVIRDQRAELLQSVGQVSRDLARTTVKIEKDQRARRKLEERLLRLERVRSEDARRLRWELKGIKYWSKAFEGQVQALLRQRYVDKESLPYPYRLTSQRFRLTSQNEEDGISWALFNEIGTDTERFIEIGCGMNGGTSGFLAQEMGWTGLMVDGDGYKVDRLIGQFGHGVQGATAWVTRDNINDLVTAHGLDGEIDLFAIDIDGADYWVWDALEACSPRMVVIEYNSLFGPDRAVVVPYEAEFDRHDRPELGAWGRYYYGASLAALISLARGKGYRLVAAEPEGANAFFLRDNVGQHIPEAPARLAFHVNENYAAHAQKAGETIFEFIERAGLPLVDVE